MKWLERNLTGGASPSPEVIPTCAVPCRSHGIHARSAKAAAGLHSLASQSFLASGNRSHRSVLFYRHTTQYLSCTVAGERECAPRWARDRPDRHSV